jgi:hypothetical protein
VAELDRGTGFELDFLAVQFTLISFNSLTEITDLDLFAFDITKSQTAVSLEPLNGSASYASSSLYDRSVLRLLSGIGIRNVKSPNLIKGVRPSFRFTTAFTLNYDKVGFLRRLDQPNELTNLAFDFYSIGLGIGPELGLNTPLGLFYLELEPGISMNWLRWEKSGSQNEIAYGGGSVNVELGFMFFIASTVNVKLFNRNYGTPAWPWASAYNQITGASANTQSANRNVSGLSIGYYFPNVKNSVKDWLF